MVLERVHAEDLLASVDPATGTVERRIFSDQEIYQLELERIFARAWLFLAHDSMIPNTGDYFMTTMGEDRVIVVRDEDGQPQVLLNSCRHRGNAVCRADEGNVSSFMCTYHGWTYDLKGKLVGVPGFKEVYHEELDRENWGLVTAAQVDTYKGFIFATLDPTAPSLPEFLGEVGRLSIDLVAERGDMVLVPGIQKYMLPCNWKFAADNVWDWYHANISHRSALMSQSFRRPPAADGTPGEVIPPPSGLRTWQKHFVALGEYGHAISGPELNDDNLPLFQSDESWRERPGVADTLGPVGMRANSHPHVFPNMWITYPGLPQVSMRFPKGTAETEIWWFTFAPREMADEVRRANSLRAMRVFGPAGMLEQDDGENWGQSTVAMRGLVSSRYPLHYAMALGHAEFNHESRPPAAISTINEHAQLWHYRNWAAWVAAESWEDLRASRPEIPDRA